MHFAFTGKKMQGCHYFLDSPLQVSQETLWVSMLRIFAAFKRKFFKN
jgi:hypothetical protein